FEPVVPAFAAAPMPVDYMQAAHEQAIAAANEARKEYDELARLAAVNSESRLAEILTGGPLENVLVHCRPTDLVVIGQANPDRPEPMRELLIETVLFESGVPVMLVPYIGSTAFQPKNILVGWDGSSTATRAIHAALPVLEKAESITVLVIEKKASAGEGQPGADVANYLARHNMNVTVEVVVNPQTSVADTVLNQVSDNGNDLVVMGGYGHSRMREFLFGGATREILEAMTVPVLMAH
ncbi:MAG: universal stress protein, partial [Rhodobacteraceae bacterium]|nr:universal stress protein [Paracoccaceae bacterium]